MLQAATRDIYEGSIDELVGGVVHGVNGTVFAYGATGSGKTYSMVGKVPILLHVCSQKQFLENALCCVGGVDESGSRTLLPVLIILDGL